ncbi:MAG: glucokinase [Candidatus Puniceispirillaceae bacterium]
MSRLVVDIGGTSVRIAHQRVDAAQTCDPAALKDPEVLACADFATAGDALLHYCNQYRLDIELLGLAVAGPVTGAAVDITNNHWQFDAAALTAAIGARRYLLVNDFTAQALAQRDLLQGGVKLSQKHRQILRRGKGDLSTPLLVIGPGTGLGVAALVPDGEQVQIIEGEGGHVSYAPRNAAEQAVLADLAAEFGHVSAELIISGPGLEAVYYSQTGEKRPAPDIGGLALVGDAAALAAVSLMLQSLATVAANAVLSLGARAGVVIAGGIVPKLADLLGDSGFFDRFDDHGRRRSYLETVPIYLSSDPLGGLRGMAAGFDNPYLSQRIIHV